MMDRLKHYAPLFLSGFGILVLLQIIGEWVYVLVVSNPLGVVWVAGVITALPFTLGLVYSGYWLSNSSIEVERYERIVLWAGGGLGLFMVINLILMVTLPAQSGARLVPPSSRLRLVSWARWAATLGAGTGLLVGIFEARGIERAVEAERERVRAAQAQAREDLLSYLNATLRHEVLNTATVIVGQADLITTDYHDTGDIPERMEKLKTRTQEMKAVIEDIRVLLHASKEEAETRPIDVTGLLADEIATIEESYESVEIETSILSQALTRADTPLRRAFANLLRNAVEHNDSDVPQITVTVETDEETVRVRIGDNGPGIPAPERETLFERHIRSDANHGLGLALTKTLVENYNGTVELTETGPDGTVFTIELPSVPERPPEHRPDRSDPPRQSARPTSAGTPTQDRR